MVLFCHLLVATKELLRPPKNYLSHQRLIHIWIIMHNTILFICINSTIINRCTHNISFNSGSDMRITHKC